MDIVEFAEKFYGVVLPVWQKKHIRALYEKSRDEPIRIVIPKNAGRRQAYIYMNQKELVLNGKTTDCK